MPRHLHLARPPEMTGPPDAGRLDNSPVAATAIRIAPRVGVQFECAQALLACALGSSPEHAAWALGTAAEHFELDAEGAAAWFLRWMSVDEDYAEALLRRVAGPGMLQETAPQSSAAGDPAFPCRP